MQVVYIVKSGQLIDLVGWEWLNLKAFADLSDAKSFMKVVKKQIKPKDLGVKEDVEIEELTVDYG
jgi:hypothetical protein